MFKLEISLLYTNVLLFHMPRTGGPYGILSFPPQVYANARGRGFESRRQVLKPF